MADIWAGVKRYNTRGGCSLRTVLVQGHAHGESGLNGAEPEVMKRGLCYTCAK